MNDKTPTKPEQKQPINNQIIKESIKNLKEANQNQDIEVNKNLQYITNKKAYKTFLRLVRDNKFTTAIVASEITGVTRQTISKWLETPLVRQVMNNTINRYVDKIAQARDWKASAYLIDKLQGKEGNTTNIQVNTLDGLTIIRR